MEVTPEILKILDPFIERGILGMGWIFAIFLLIRNVRINDRATAALIDNSQAMHALGDAMAGAVREQVTAINNLSTEVKVMAARGDAGGRV